jgi:F420 biosynthesis protein FbiB-like protein
MQVLDAIAQRRSIRRFKDSPVPEEDIRAILHAATLAPSGKNKQPWRFIVVEGEAQRAEMVRIMRAGTAELTAQGINPGSSEWTAKSMEQAPVTIFIFDEGETNDERERSFVDFLMNTVDIQSIGAAIQNMLLAALDRGLGTLWICDVFYAYEGLCEWLGENHVMVAAVSVGYPDEDPGPRPRKTVDEVTRWLA